MEHGTKEKPQGGPVMPEIEIYQRAIFGYWDKNDRVKGLLEKVTDHESNFKLVKIELRRHMKAIYGLYALLLIPFLQSLGIQTKDLLSLLSKITPNILSLLH